MPDVIAAGNTSDIVRLAEMNLGAAATAQNSSGSVNPVTLETFTNLVRPTAAVQECPLPLVTCTSNTQVLVASGQADFWLAYFPAGRLINSITFAAGTTGSSGLTHSFAALYQTSGALMSQSPDNTTAEWTNATLRTFTLNTPQLITTAGYFYVALSVTVTVTMPTTIGIVTAAAASTKGPASGLHFTDTTHTGLNGTAAATFTANTAIAGYSYWYVS